MTMMLGSIVRGAIVAGAVTVALALPRSIDLQTQAWIGVLIVLHLALPVAAAFWGRRADTLSLDVGLAGIGIAYIGVLALTRDGSGWLYIGLPLGYALYGILATIVFNGLSTWRRALRLRTLKRQRAERRRPSEAATAR